LHDGSREFASETADLKNRRGEKKIIIELKMAEKER
jgi:hypothetical protein